jgi:hypothetical protein
MGAFLDKPKTEKAVDEGCDAHGHAYCMGAMQGWRMDQEVRPGG